MTKAPAWMSKYPCENCETGYGLCREGLSAGLQCCKECAHPSYVLARPHQWTADELEEMWSGREMPASIVRELELLRRS